MPNCSVLFVDGGGLAEVLGRALSGAGVRNFVLPGGDLGVGDWVRENQPRSVLLVDLRRPLRTGRVFLRTVRTEAPSALVMGNSLSVPLYARRLETEGYACQPADVNDVLQDVGQFLKGF